MTGPLLFLRARSAWVLPILMLATAVLSATVTKDLTAVPWSEGDLALVVLAATPLPGGLLHLALRRPSVAVERPAALLRLARFLWWLMAVSLLFLSAYLPQVGGPLAAASARSTVLLASLTTLFALHVNAGVAWLPALGYAGANLTYGTTGPGIAQPWALLMQEVSPVGIGVSAVLAVLAGWRYAMHDLACPRA